MHRMQHVSYAPFNDSEQPMNKITPFHLNWHPPKQINKLFPDWIWLISAATYFNYHYLCFFNEKRIWKSI